MAGADQMTNEQMIEEALKGKRRFWPLGRFRVWMLHRVRSSHQPLLLGTLSGSLNGCANFSGGPILAFRYSFVLWLWPLFV